MGKLNSYQQNEIKIDFQKCQMSLATFTFDLHNMSHNTTVFFRVGVQKDRIESPKNTCISIKHLSQRDCANKLKRTLCLW